jgi:DHA2 family multidrug resistance protein
MGLIFVPMNLIAFATLPPVLRTDGSALFNLMRNVGSAIGVSITTTMLASSIQTMHAQLASHINPFNRALSVNAPSMMWNPKMPFGVAQLDSIVQYNAQIIAYANDFLFMFFISLPALLVLFLMRRPALLQKPPEIEVME